MWWVKPVNRILSEPTMNILESLFMVGSERIPVYTEFGLDTIPVYSWLVQRGFQFIQGSVWNPL
jgi:hypothetical protein